MNYRKLVGFFLSLSILFFVFAVVVMLPCDPQRNFVCEGRYTEIIGQPLFFGSIPLILVFLLLFFLPADYFKAWLKYAAWFIVVAVIWIAMSDVTCGGFLPSCIDKELATWWSSGIYLVLSLIVILITYLKRRASH